jgi:hypothetical protein
MRGERSFSKDTPGAADVDVNRVDDDEIDDRCTVLREKLEAERQKKGTLPANAKSLKSHQVHDLAEAKIRESERLRRALGIRLRGRKPLEAKGTEAAS